METAWKATAMKFFSIGFGWLQPNRDAAADWSADPLSHPDLERMSLVELADLPMSPFGYAAPEGEGDRPRRAGRVAARAARPRTATGMLHCPGAYP
jgi:hypothetical protein